MKKFIHKSKVGVTVATILLTVASVSPAFAANTGDSTNVFAPLVADGNNLDGDSQTNTFGLSGIISNDNQLINSDENTINGSANELNNSDFNTITGNENKLTNSSTNNITGDKNELTNSDINTINGNNNTLDFSDSNTIIGSSNILTASSTEKNDSNTITGNGNILNGSSYSNTITGDTNNLTDSYSNTITGNRNKLNNTYSSTITGSDIVLDNREFVAVVGNEVTIEADNATALGYKSTVTGENSVALGANSIADRPNTVSVGSPLDQRQITNVANGTAPNDAVNVGQWMAGNANTESKIYTSGALAAALTGIMPLDYDPNARTQIGVGVGSYHGERAVAIGVNHYVNESLLVNAGMSADGSDRMYRGGLTWRLGQSTKKVESTEMGNLRSQLQQQQSELQQLKQQMAALTSATGQTSVVEQSPVQAIVIQDVLFAFDEDTLQHQAYPILDKVVSTVKNNPSWNYVLVGHTDSKGTDAYNMDLSLRRVKAVQNYLISQGVPANLLSIQKDGELQPKETNTTAEGRAENRRVEIHIN